MNHDALYKQFGRVVRGHRKNKGLSQEQLGLRLKLSRTSVTNIEYGRQRVMLHQVFEIAAALELAPEALVPTVAQLQNSEDVENRLARLTDVLPELRAAPELRDWVASVISAPTKVPPINSDGDKNK